MEDIDHDSWWRLNLFVVCYLLLELLFYWRYIDLSKKANIKIHPYMTQPKITATQCEYLTSQAVYYAGICDGGYRGFFSKWFDCKFEEIYEENIREWIRWAIFVDIPMFKLENIYHNIHYDAKTKSFELNSKVKDENKNEKVFDNKWKEEFVERKLKMVCQLCKVDSMPKGKNDKINFASNNNKSEIACFHRPLIFYIGIEIATLSTNLFLKYYLGLKTMELNGFKIWYFINNIDSTRCTRDIQHRPMFFVHGLGIGFFAYVNFIYQLIKKMKIKKENCSVDSMFLIELPWINMSLRHFLPNISDIWPIKWLMDHDSNLGKKFKAPKYTYKSSFMLGKDAPPANNDIYIDILFKIEKYIFGMTQATQDRNMKMKLQCDWTLMGHSYGTFIVSAMYRDLQKALYQNTRLIVTDPVSLLLSHPVTVGAVCWNADDWADYFFQLAAMRELMLSITLTRYMHWYEHVLYTSQLIQPKHAKCKKNIVAVSSGDRIVPVKDIIKSIEMVNERQDLIDYTVFDGLPHAVWLFRPSLVKKVIQMI